MSAKNPAKLLAKTTLALGWLVLAMVTTTLLAADPPPTCTTTFDKDWCRQTPVNIPLCKFWTNTTILKCQGQEAEPKADPPKPAIAAEASEIMPVQFYYCKNVPEAWLPDWYLACIPWANLQGEPEYQVCYRRYRCRWAGGATLDCVRGTEILPENWQPAYTMTDFCFTQADIPPP